MSQPLVSIDLKRGIFRRYSSISRYTGKPLLTHRFDIVAEDWEKVLKREWVVEAASIEEFRVSPREEARVGWSGPPRGPFTPRGGNAA